jgi:rhodanese-related sulfurtransferase
VKLIIALLEITLAVSFAQVPEPAPNLNIDGVDGRRLVIRPAALQKPLLVHFFSLRSPGWRDELLKLKSLDERYGPQGLALVSIAAPEPGARETAAAFAVKSGLSFPIAVDAGNLSAFSRDRVPRLVLISPDAAIALRLYEPPRDAQIREIESRLPALLERRKELLDQAAASARRQQEFEAASLKVAAITPDQLKARLGTPLPLYFIGDKKVFDEKHIPGAAFLDPRDVDRFFKDQDKTQEWIFYCDCARGALSRSGRVATELYLKGFKRAAYLKGQMQEWEKRKYPLQVRTVK